MAHKALLILVYLFVMFPFASEPLLAINEHGPTGMSLTADYTPHDPISISSDDDFETQGWPGSGTPEEPYKIENLSIDGSSSEICVSIENTRSYFIIRNCYLFNGTHGIHLDNAANGLIEYNELDDVSFGILLFDSGNSTIFNNTVIGQISINSDEGIALHNSYNTTISNNNCTGPWNLPISLYHSDNCTISSNICSSKREGSLGMWLRFSNNNALFNNTCNMNSEAGIGMYDSNHNNLINNTCNMNSEHGIYIGGFNCSAINNTAIGNTYGLRVYSGVDCVLTDNTIMNNEQVGIQLTSLSEFNEVYSNTVGWNRLNARDDGSDNSWDDGASIGNRWGDYTGSETYYSIYGEANSVDHYPLKADIISPVVDAPADIEYELGTTGNSITWRPSDDHPDMYQVMRNGAPIDSGVWDGADITHYVDGLDWGVYNYSLIVNDTCANLAIDVVIVSVVDSIYPVIDSPEDITYEESGTGYSITWSPSDVHPFNYTVYLEGELHRSGLWNSSSETVVVTVDGFSLGTHNFTIVVMDVGYNWVSDTVLVIVTERILPSIDSPNDITYDELSTNNKIIWNPFDAHPSQYTVYKNGSIYTSGEWDGSTIILDIDGLSMGTYNFTILVKDVDDNNAIDTVIVVVVDGTNPTIDSPSDVLLIEGGTDYVIIWRPYDLHPISYTIASNDIVIASGLWNTSDESISLSLLDFAVGTYNVTLVVTDIVGNTASNSVLVTVLPISASTAFGVPPEMSILLLLSAASAVVVIVLVFIWLRKRTGQVE